MSEPDTGPAAEDVDGVERDPLSTDDGLAAAAETMPEVETTPDPGENAIVLPEPPLVDEPALDVTDDGDDPLAEHVGLDPEAAYDAGGTLGPGTTLVTNTTGRDEYLATGADASAAG
jgi:hypothetical protein